MYYLNKIVYAFLCPLDLALMAVVAALVLLALNRARARQWAAALLAFAVVGLYFFSTTAATRLLGLPLERAYPVQRTADAPKADAIVLLGGGMWANPTALVYPEMEAAADRVWHAARLYNAGKAPLVIPTGLGADHAEQPLLRDFGVPDDAILVENDARNTEENARFVERTLRARLGDGARPRVLLVTSAWHMRRSELMFARYAPGLEIIPAAADYEATLAVVRPWTPKFLLPSPDALAFNNALFKEFVGYWGYRLLR